MKPKRTVLLATFVITMFLLTAASAELIDNGYGLIYDDVLDITWAQPSDVRTDWSEAKGYVGDLRLGGVSRWRLPYTSVAAKEGPTILDPVDCSTASELDCRDNELGYMFYHNLSGTSGQPILDSGDPDLALFPTLQSDNYWSGTGGVPGATAWGFAFFNGTSPQYGSSDSSLFSWAVHKGNVVPVIDEIIGTWDSGIWYWDVAASIWTQMWSSSTNGDIAAGDFTADGIADVASIWSVGLWYQDGDTLDWFKIDDRPPIRVTAGDVTGDGRDEIIASYDSGIWYWDLAASKWTKMTPASTNGDIAAGYFTADGKADVASIWSSGLWYQDGDTLDWTRIDERPPIQVTAGDVTGDGRDEIIASYDNGIWYWDVAASKWTKMTSASTNGDIAAGDFTADGKADVASIWRSGLWYQDGDTLDWTRIDERPPIQVTAGDVTGN